MTGSSKAEAFALRRRPVLEKWIDNGFRQSTILMAAMVALILVAIFVTVFLGAREAISHFGLKFLTTSAWDPVNERYGAVSYTHLTLPTILRV